MPLSLKQILDLVGEFLLDIVRFPWWWYAGGAQLVGGWCWRGFTETIARVSLGRFVKYLFVPMYQDYSATGRILSFFMRLTMSAGKLVRLVVSAAWYGAVFVAWILLLPFALAVVLS